jgi:hypothetical protein
MIGDMVSAAQVLKCPHLIMIGQHDHVAVEAAEDTYDSNKRIGMRPSLKIFSTEETGASPGQIDNPTLAKEFVFEWLRRQLMG